MSDNRVLLGKHPNHGYGGFVSKDGTDVTASDNDFFLFDTTANNVSSHGQLLLWKEVTVTSSGTTSITFKSGGRRCFVQATMSWAQTGSDSASDISCISESANTTRSKARWSHYGNVQNSSGSGDDLSYSISVTYSGSGASQTGTIVITRVHTGETDVGRDICVQCMVWKEQGN